MGTVIFFLLRWGEEFWWYCIDAVEIWFYYVGDVLELELVQVGERRCYCFGLVVVVWDVF